MQSPHTGINYFRLLEFASPPNFSCLDLANLNIMRSTAKILHRLIWHKSGGRSAFTYNLTSITKCPYSTPWNSRDRFSESRSRFFWESRNRKRYSRTTTSIFTSSHWSTMISGGLHIFTMLRIGSSFISTSTTRSCNIFRVSQIVWSTLEIQHQLQSLVPRHP